MVQYLMRVGIAGAAFLGIQLWTRYKGKASYDRFLHERENPLSKEKMTIEEYLAERRNALGAPDKFLSINNFDLHNMEGVAAPRNR